VNPDTCVPVYVVALERTLRAAQRDDESCSSLASGQMR